MTTKNTDWVERFDIEFGCLWRENVDGKSKVTCSEDVKSFIQDLIDNQRKEIVKSAIEFVEAESGKSGRREILEFLASLAKVGTLEQKEEK